MDDDRFKGIATDPRFRPLPSRYRKVKIDDRFKGMFTEKKFKVKCSVDERGRPVKLSSNKHLKKFYELSSEEDSDDDEGGEPADDAAIGEVNVADDNVIGGPDTGDIRAAGSSAIGKTDKDRKRKKKRGDDKHKSKINEEEEEDEELPVLKKEINPMEDYARGIVMMSSSSEDEDDEDDESLIPYDQEAHGDHYWGEHDEDAEETEEVTNRLAVQNMDWDRIKAYDLFMLLDSFKPATGTVKSVKIYPSEFGKENMKQDDLSGPKELRKSQLNEAGEGQGKLKSLSEKDQKRAMLENLRQYQLNRLKYYYAVAEFDSPETANYIYTNCDGREYLASCTQLDLRFIPDDMEFAEDEVKDSANHVPDNYEPKFFINPALGQSLVKCTWDETAPDRYGMLNKKYKPNELEELDMNDYLASESDEEITTEVISKKKSKETKPSLRPTDSALLAESSSDDEDGGSIEKYRALLLGGLDKVEEEMDDDAVDMEITWDTGLKDTTEELVKGKSKKGKREELSVFDREREKKKEKAKLQKKEKKESKKVQQVEAFSDDEIPEEFVDAFSKSNKGAPGNKKKKRRRKVSETSNDPAPPAQQVESTSLDLIATSSDGPKSTKHFNIKEIAEYENMTKSKRKRKMKKNQLKEIEDDFEIDVKDDRFNALYTSALFNIDPSSQNYRKTKAMDAIVNEKQRKIRDGERTILKPSKSKKDQSSKLTNLVKSVKAKTKMHSKK